MRKIIFTLFILVTLNVSSQPPKNPTVHPACLTPNPPWWCGEHPANPLPLDDYLPILMVLGGAIGAYFYWKKTKFELKSEQL
tara:strand:+ start:212 stop:457 length:246 start_codon:yes stop_codon:yes gene_type:complete